MEAKDANEMRLARLRRFGQFNEKDDQMNSSKDDSKDDSKYDGKDDSKDCKDSMDTKDGMQ